MKRQNMKMRFTWHGGSDPVPARYIRQIPDLVDQAWSAANILAPVRCYQCDPVETHTDWDFRRCGGWRLILAAVDPE